MSVRVAFDPALFAVQRAESLSGGLDGFIIGGSQLGAALSAWVTVPLASFTYTNGYQPNADNTLIIDAETARVSLSFWENAGDVLYPSDRVRVVYAGKVLFLGTVDSTSITYATDPDAKAHGATRRVDFSATVVGTYAAAMSKTVEFVELPEETPITRISRWVTVDNWEG
ncbi:MAG TPA: hypothetical protein VK453_24305 [Micromonosporaceae bacterium]|nr:hypothetical protein [Micromonosporaceae bacterium]